jgi:hypothetical protein
LITIYIQTHGTNEAIAYGEPYANVTDALEGIEELKYDYDLMECVAATDECRAEMDLDGHFYAGWRMHVEDAAKFDYVAIVGEA